MTIPEKIMLRLLNGQQRILANPMHIQRFGPGGGRWSRLPQRCDLVRRPNPIDISLEWDRAINHHDNEAWMYLSGFLGCEIISYPEDDERGLFAFSWQIWWTGLHGKPLPKVGKNYVLPGQKFTDIPRNREADAVLSRYLHKMREEKARNGPHVIKNIARVFAEMPTHYAADVRSGLAGILW